jgi:hypothetical protein
VTFYLFDTHILLWAAGLPAAAPNPGGTAQHLHLQRSLDLEGCGEIRLRSCGFHR